VQYKDVVRDHSLLEEMLTHSGGRRDVPVIVDAGKVTIGYGGS
jgi:glutaredoxin